MYKKLLAVLVVGFILVGCGDKSQKLNFASTAEFRTSLMMMSEDLEDQDKLAFTNAMINVDYLVENEIKAKFGDKADEETTLKMFKDKLGGKSAQEIIEEYGY